MNARRLTPSVSIISWRGNFYVVPQFINERGLRANGKPIAIVPQSATSNDLGSAILAAMDRFGLSAPSIFEVRSWENGKKKPKDPVLVATGASSFSALWKEDLFISCGEDSSDTLHFNPSRKAGRSQYLFKPDTETVRISRAATPELIGEAARQAFKRCD